MSAIFFDFVYQTLQLFYFCKKNQIKYTLFMPTLSLCEKEIILQTNIRKSAVELIKYKLTDELVSSDIVRSSAPRFLIAKRHWLKK